MNDGALAAKAVAAVIPSTDEFPYAVRVVAELFVLTVLLQWLQPVQHL